LVCAIFADRFATWPPFLFGGLQREERTDVYENSAADAGN
jgi:hypothetical protein